MDRFESKDLDGHTLSMDPQLRTTARNYKFKYNCSERLEKVITQIQMERVTRTSRDSKGSNHRVLPTSARVEPTFLKQNIAGSAWKEPSDIQVKKTASRGTIVKVMTDDEIETMISEALASRQMTPVQSDGSISLKGIPSEPFDSLGMGPYKRTCNVRRVESKFSTISEEVILCEQPQWVQIKPAEKAVASLGDVRESSSTNTPETVLDLTENRSVDDYLFPEENQHDMTADSPHTKSSDDVELRNNGLDQVNDGNTPPDSPLSFGMESPLNASEHAEVMRVLGHRPDAPAVQREPSDSQIESLYSSSSDDEQENDADDSKEDTESDRDPRNPEINEIYRAQQSSHPKKQHLHPNASVPPIPRIAKSLNTPRSISNRSSARTRDSPRSPPVTPLDKKARRQIEFLKQEKIRIFSKMTTIHEKIIDTLDRLRISLVELSLPDGQVEVKLRERNAFEFSVRFSRNYLFPLGQMMDDLREIPNEEFQSATTNEACIKVCGVYGLLNQALQCYCKQLRHFFTDSVPQKLDILLNLIKETTKMCLHKKIFDERDALIQCIIMRCSLFSEFVSKASEEIKTARKEEYPLRTGRREPNKIPRTSSKWDLTMNLNNLNMYEPKLVPKAQKKKPQKKIVSTSRLSSRQRVSRQTFSLPSPSHTEKYPEREPDCIVEPPADPDDTQIRRTAANSESTHKFNSILEEQPEVEVPKSLVEALENITKNEVHQMLGPLFLHLDSVLRKSVSPSNRISLVK